MVKGVGWLRVGWRVDLFFGETGDDLLLFGATGCTACLYFFFAVGADDLSKDMIGLESFFDILIVVHA